MSSSTDIKQNPWTADPGWGVSSGCLIFSCKFKKVYYKIGYQTKQKHIQQRAVLVEVTEGQLTIPARGLAQWCCLETGRYQ